jgi:hypothetical protein
LGSGISKERAPKIATSVFEDKPNVILPWGRLTNFMTTHFCCKHCGLAVLHESISKYQATFATSVGFHCSDSFFFSTSKVDAETTTDVIEKESSYVLLLPTANCALNIRMVLALQRLGSGQASAAAVGATMLGIFPDAFHSKWTALEEVIGKTQVLVGTNILTKNIEQEKALLKQDDKGCYLFCVSIDAGWNNQGSDRAYNSNSGHHITVGKRSGLVVALHYMSKCCSKCGIATKTGKPHLDDADVCARNYTGSSKGMEAHGALHGCLNLHRNHNIIYEIIIMDDDSCTKSILSWNFQEAITEGLMTKAPKTANGNKKADKGQLPTSHLKLKRLADHNHRNRCWAGKCYNYAYATKGKSECLTTDAERLKRNLTYTLHQYKGEDFATFKRMIWAVFYHHFNVHGMCGEW